MHAPTTHKVNRRESENTARNHMGDANYKGTAKQHMCHESIKTTRLLLDVAKCKKYNTNHHINSMCHECIKTTCLLLGVAKYKES